MDSRKLVRLFEVNELEKKTLLDIDMPKLHFSFTYNFFFCRPAIWDKCFFSKAEYVLSQKNFFSPKCVQKQFVEKMNKIKEILQSLDRIRNICYLGIQCQVYTYNFFMFWKQMFLELQTVSLLFRLDNFY